MSEWNNRLGVLKNEINYWINNRSDKMIHIVKLFFDLNVQLKIYKEKYVLKNDFSDFKKSV